MGAGMTSTARSIRGQLLVLMRLWKSWSDATQTRTAFCAAIKRQVAEQILLMLEADPCQLPLLNAKQRKSVVYLFKAKLHQNKEVLCLSI